VISAVYEQRGARASLLAARTEPAREPLEFAALVSKAQARLAEALESRTFRGVFAEDAETLASLHEPLIRVIAERGPEPLAATVRDRLRDDLPTACTRLGVYWNGDATTGDDYLSRLLIQPYAEVLRARGVAPDRGHKRGHCPFCGGRPWISVRKSPSSEDGGLRFLCCSLCGLEWNFNRGCCPACFEEDPYKLPVFRTDEHPLVRIEACETCRRYIKSIDLTQDARPIPAIDDLVSLSMDLWAMDEGFIRIEPGVAGV
jgi:formate dehydrogenase maturation protein FdhE